MRVAIVSYYAPPQPAVASHRVLRMSRALLAEGHDVHWVTLERDQLLKEDATLAGLIPEAVRVHGLGGPCLYQRPEARSFAEKVLRTLAFELPRRFAFADGFFEWNRRLRRELASLLERERIDAVLFCCGPHGQSWVAPRLRAALPELRIYIDYRDLLSGNPWNDANKSPRQRARLVRKERRVLAAADALFVNTEEAKARFVEVVGVPDGLEVEVMRNTADYELADLVTSESARDPVQDETHGETRRKTQDEARGEGQNEAQSAKPDGLKLGFFGTIFPKRRLLEVFRALECMPPENLTRVTLHAWTALAHETPSIDEDLAQVAPRVAERVRQHALVPWGDALRAMRGVDVLVLVNSPDADDAVFVPGKLYDYLMARRPILFVGAPGDASRIVAQSSGADWVFGYGEAAAVAARLGSQLAAGTATLLPATAAFAPRNSFAPLLDRLRESSTAPR